MISIPSIAGHYRYIHTKSEGQHSLVVARIVIADLSDSNFHTHTQNGLIFSSRPRVKLRFQSQVPEVSLGRTRRSLAVTRLSYSSVIPLSHLFARTFFCFSSHAFLCRADSDHGYWPRAIGSYDLCKNASLAQRAILFEVRRSLLQTNLITGGQRSLGTCAWLVSHRLSEYIDEWTS